MLEAPKSRLKVVTPLTLKSTTTTTTTTTTTRTCMSASLSFSPLKKTLVVASRGRRHHHRMLSSICVRRPRANAVGGDDGRESRPRRRGRSSEGGRGGGRGRRSTKSSEEDYKITLRNIRKSSKRFDTDEQVSEMYGRSAELKKAMESGMPSVEISERQGEHFYGWESTRVRRCDRIHGE